MKKLIQALLDAEIPKSLKTLVVFACFLILLRIAGIPVGEYVDVSLKYVFSSLPGLKMMLRGTFVAGLISVLMVSVFLRPTLPLIKGRSRWIIFSVVALWALGALALIYGPTIIQHQ